MLILIVIFVALIVYNLKVCPINQYNEVSFDKKTSSSLFGISTILILYHHIAQYIGNTSENVMFFFGSSIIGNLGVGIFFFISGFGLLYNHKNNPKYLKSIVTKKIPAIYFVYVLTNAIYLIYFACLGTKFTFVQVLTNLFGIVCLNNFKVINVNAWFIPTILVFYVAFVLIYYIGNKIKLNNELCSIFMVIFMVTFYILNEVLPYRTLFRRSIFCFLIGIVYALYYEVLNKFIRKHYLWCLFVVITIFALNQFFFTIIDKSQTQSVCMVCFIILLLQKVNFGNIILSTIKRIGIEIYLMQYLFTHLFKNAIPLLDISANWYALAVFASTIVSALIVHWVIKYSKKGIIKLHKHIKFKKQEPLIG